MHTLVLPHRGANFERQGEGFFCAAEKDSLRAPVTSSGRVTADFMPQTTTWKEGSLFFFPSSGAIYLSK